VRDVGNKIRGVGDVGMLKFGHHSARRGFTIFTDRPVFAFLHQGIFDGESACGAHPRCLALSHSTRGCA
jgi:hypothetical protein